MIPAFKLQLNNPILRGLAATGKYDGEHASLTCATTAGKIFFHSPHEKDPQNEVRFLNINRKISALACGRLNPKTGRELLLVGAQTTLLAYDVRENSDLFFRDAPDGVNVIVVGQFADIETPLALVGGVDAVFAQLLAGGKFRQQRATPPNPHLPRQQAIRGSEALWRR